MSAHHMSGGQIAMDQTVSENRQPSDQLQSEKGAKNITT